MMFFVPPLEMSKFLKDVASSIMRFKTDPLQEYDTEYLDIDKLLSLYVE